MAPPEPSETAGQHDVKEGIRLPVRTSTKRQKKKKKIPDIHTLLNIYSKYLHFNTNNTTAIKTGNIITNFKVAKGFRLTLLTGPYLLDSVE